jgi:hypothetical protein
MPILLVRLARAIIGRKYIFLCIAAQIKNVCGCPDDKNLYDLLFAEVCKGIRAVEIVPKLIGL